MLVPRGFRAIVCARGELCRHSSDAMRVPEPVLFLGEPCAIGVATRADTGDGPQRFFDTTSFDTRDGRTVAGAPKLDRKGAVAGIVSGALGETYKAFYDGCYRKDLTGTMRRTVIGGVVLLLSGVISARSKTDPLVFVFLRVDRVQDVAILRPMIAPDIGVQLDSGPRELKPGAVLQCSSSLREHDAIVETKIAKVTDLMLDCGDHKFVVKSLDFSPRGK